MPNNTTPALLGLCEEHEHARAFVRGELVAFLLRSMRHCQAITVFVVSRLAIDQEHVVMGLIALNVMEGDMPGIEDAVANKRHSLPMRERANKFHGGRFDFLAVRKAPAKYF